MDKVNVMRSKYDGPFKVIDTTTHGAITFLDDTCNTFKVNNGHCLKVFLEPEIDMVEELYVIEFIEILG